MVNKEEEDKELTEESQYSKKPVDKGLVDPKYVDCRKIPKIESGYCIPLFVGIIEAAFQLKEILFLSSRLHKLGVEIPSIEEALSELTGGEKTIDEFLEIILDNEISRKELQEVVGKVDKEDLDDTVQAFSDIFCAQVIIHEAGIESPKMYNPETDPRLEVILYDEDYEDHSLLLYKAKNSFKSRKLKWELLKLLVEVKVAESKIACCVATNEPISLEKIKSLFSHISKKYMELKTVKKKSNFLHFLEILLQKFELKGNWEGFLEVFKNSKAARESITSNSKEYCLKCYKAGQHKFCCGHQVCEECFEEYLNKEQGKVWTCPFSGCLYVLNKAEQSRIGYHQPPKDCKEKNGCGICGTTCTKVNVARLHDDHILCRRCLKAYIEQITEGRVYKYIGGTGELELYDCPFRGCSKSFSYELVSGLYTFEDNTKLFQAARKNFSLIG